jgi:hypothetical protein
MESSNTPEQVQSAVPPTPEETAEQVLFRRGSDIMRHAQQNGMPREQAAEALQDANALLIQAVPALLLREPDQNKRLAKFQHWWKLEQLFGRCMANAEHSTARAVLADELAFLDRLGLIPPSRTETNEDFERARVTIREKLREVVLKGKLDQWPGFPVYHATPPAGERQEQEEAEPVECEPKEQG